jgi:hypothetical protein
MRVAEPSVAQEAASPWCGSAALARRRAVTGWAAGIALMWGVCASGTVHAAPEQEDAVTRFLEQRGLLQSMQSVASSPLLQQWRHQASDLVLSAMNFLGTPYKWGGNSADEGFDCSGFTRHVFELSLGLVLPRRSDEQAKADGLAKVRQQDLQPGDLVFFNTRKRNYSHVGIYVGDSRFIHAPRSGAAVRVESMTSAYWSKRYNGARRAAGIDAPSRATVVYRPHDTGATSAYMP